MAGKSEDLYQDNRFDWLRSCIRTESKEARRAGCTRRPGPRCHSRATSHGPAACQAEMPARLQIGHAMFAD